MTVCMDRVGRSVDVDSPKFEVLIHNSYIHLQKVDCSSKRVGKNKLAARDTGLNNIGWECKRRASDKILLQWGDINGSEHNLG